MHNTTVNNIMELYKIILSRLTKLTSGINIYNTGNGIWWDERNSNNLYNGQKKLQ